MLWRPFDYKNLDEVNRDIEELGVNLPTSEDLSVLAEPVELYGKTAKNRLAVQPLEASDSFLDGSPTDLTFRRYRRYAAGGFGLIWFESIAVRDNSMTTPHQLRITEDNKEMYRRLLWEIRDSTKDGVMPYMVAQITHCGRGSRLDGGYYKKEGGEPAYIMFDDDPYWPKPDGIVLTDDELDAIIDDYVATAVRLKEVGFDCIDIRACHGYLVSETLRSFTRKDSKYGGESFENRTRFLLTIVDRVKEATGLPITTRLNICDLVPYPYGWGMKKDGSMEPDFTEPFKLIQLLKDRGVEMINCSMGLNHATFIQMPYNVASPWYPKHHQFEAMAFYTNLAAAVKKEFPDMIVMTGTLSWPKQFSANIAAGGIKAGMYDFAGFGRQAWCYPSFPNDIFEKGGMDPKKCCLGCQKCVDMINAASPTELPGGCPIHDKEIYLPMYKAKVTDEHRQHYAHPELFELSKTRYTEE